MQPTDRAQQPPAPAERGPRRCEICSGTGFAIAEDPERGRSYARPCVCRRKSGVSDLLRLARIPRRYSGCDFEQFNILGDPLLLARNRTQTFVSEYSARKVRGEGEYGLLFLGDPGTGKTHLAVAALRSLILDHGAPGLFVDFRDLLKSMKDSFNPVSETSELKVLQPLLDAEVLLIDDLGVSKMTEWARDLIGHIITSRYNERNVTLVTSNLLDEPAGRTSTRESLQERLGPDIWSRLHEMCEVVRLEGEDFRVKVKRFGWGRRNQS